MTTYSLSANAVEQKAYRQGWARIWGKYQGTIYPVPSEADEFVVQVSPYLILNAFLPAREREINLEYAKDGRISAATISAPRLVLSQVITYNPMSHLEKEPCGCSACYPNRHPAGCYCAECNSTVWSMTRKYLYQSRFQIFMPRKEARGHAFSWTPTEDISLGAWLFPNVHGDGRICFGTSKYPNNLKIANNHFWQAPFNNDTRVTEQFSHGQCLNKTKHGWHSHMHTRAGHYGSCRRQVNHTCGCNCANKSRHSRDCKFLKGCACLCACICCKGQCQCQCLCYCCRMVCSCRCDCDFNDEFAVALKSLSTWSFSYAQAETMFGRKAIKKTGQIDGIFLSYEKKIIDSAQLKYQDRDNKDLVVGFAREIPDGEWEITFENGRRVVLDNHEVHLVT